MRFDDRAFGREPVIEGTSLHEERLDAVLDILLREGAQSVVDLGCGSGALLRRLLPHPLFTRIVGIDNSLQALAEAGNLHEDVGASRDPRLSLRHGSFCDAQDDLTGFAAATLVETIEHIDPGDLSRVERAVFALMRPALVVLTTPNREYNEVLGLEPGERRHPEHRFEWDRRRLQAWATGVAGRHGYAVEFEPIGRPHAWLGPPTQMAVFRNVSDGAGGAAKVSRP